jgi:hypothetical protein
MLGGTNTGDTEMSDFNPEQINELRAEMAGIDRIDPLSPTYRKMIALLDGMDQSMLRQIRDAKIKFLSRLAINRVAA